MCVSGDEDLASRARSKQLQCDASTVAHARVLLDARARALVRPWVDLARRYVPEVLRPFPRAILHGLYNGQCTRPVTGGVGKASNSGVQRDVWKKRSEPGAVFLWCIGWKLREFDLGIVPEWVECDSLGVYRCFVQEIE